MKSFQLTIVILTFIAATADCYIHLLPCLAGWPDCLLYVGRFGLMAISITAGAFVAHVLVSALQGVSVLEGLVQDEPVELEVYQ